MHLSHPAAGVIATDAIAGGGVPIATGAAWADLRLGRGAATLCFFGDGAVYQGILHESANLAALWKVPVVFVIENNQYAVATPVRETCAAGRLSDVAAAYGLPGGAGGRDGPARRDARGARAAAGERSAAAPRLPRGGDLPLLPPLGHPRGQRVRLPDRRGGGRVAVPRPDRRGAASSSGARERSTRKAAPSCAGTPIAAWPPRWRRARSARRPASRCPTGCGPTRARSPSACGRTGPAAVRAARPGDRGPAPSRPTTSRARRRSATWRRSPRSRAAGSSATRGWWCSARRWRTPTAAPTAPPATSPPRFPDRVINTPISEAGFTGLACGAALNGLRPVVEIMFPSFALVAADQLFNQAGQLG